MVDFFIVFTCNEPFSLQPGCKRTDNVFDACTRALDALALNPARDLYHLFFNSA